MEIIHLPSGNCHKVRIVLVEAEDFRNLTKSRYFFDWKQEKGKAVYKHCQLDTPDILGLVSIERIPDEWRIHIRLLTVAAEHVGRNKKFEHIAGNLITFVSRIALKEFGELACVSLKPKDAIHRHYMENYSMYRAGMSLCLDIRGIKELVETYGYE